MGDVTLQTFIIFKYFLQSMLWVRSYCYQIVVQAQPLLYPLANVIHAIQEDWYCTPIPKSHNGHIRVMAAIAVGPIARSDLIVYNRLL